MKNKIEIETELRQFTGTECYYQYNGTYDTYMLTDGIKYLAESCGCYWLLNIIDSYQANLKDADFQVWILNVSDSSALITCEDGNRNDLVQQFIEFTDFPLDSIKIYLIDGILLLASEY